MDIRTYQLIAEEYMIYPRHIAHEYPTLGLVGEAGEIANKVKKISRDGLDPADLKDDIKAELGDVLWYLAAVATEFDISLTEVATYNLRKLEDRKVRGVVGGSGDNR
jgi:NTP pyrophosphatase (non-canonical NTP hydrolase)